MNELVNELVETFTIHVTWIPIFIDETCNKWYSTINLIIKHSEICCTRQIKLNYAIIFTYFYSLALCEARPAKRSSLRHGLNKNMNRNSINEFFPFFFTVLSNLLYPLATTFFPVVMLNTTMNAHFLHHWYKMRHATRHLPPENHKLKAKYYGVIEVLNSDM